MTKAIGFVLFTMLIFGYEQLSFVKMCNLCANWTKIISNIHRITEFFSSILPLLGEIKVYNCFDFGCMGWVYSILGWIGLGQEIWLKRANLRSQTTPESNINISQISQKSVQLAYCNVPYMSHFKRKSKLSKLYRVWILYILQQKSTWFIIKDMHQCHSGIIIRVYASVTCRKVFYMKSTTKNACRLSYIPFLPKTGRDFELWYIRVQRLVSYFFLSSIYAAKKKIRLYSIFHSCLTGNQVEEMYSF